MDAKTLDAVEKEYFAPGPAPFDCPAQRLEETAAFTLSAEEPTRISLNGEYWLADGGTVAARTAPDGDWSDAIPAHVPESVHTSLYRAGRIPDPLFGKNDKAAREESYKTWWYKREFTYDFSLEHPMLCFDGVCYNAVFWLNGVFLGGHIGMFGGPFFDVSSILQEQNTLIVKVENAPADPRPYSAYADHDEGWKYGVVVNCVYGWHYACIPTRGIWSEVYLRSRPAVETERPFLLTHDYRDGTVDVCVSLSAAAAGTVAVTVAPHNFEGETRYFTGDFAETRQLHYRLALRDVRLWWPNGYGEQNLYDVTVCIHPAGSAPQIFHERIGVRTVEMRPEVSGADEARYCWRCFVNGQYIFLKGTNWCTLDALLRLPEERYDRFLPLAQHQNLQLLRAWGGGIPESDYFYEKCDELGLMVAQEWPTCWDSQKVQPLEALEETARLNTVRLRNHPSLLWWAGGNESAQADGEAMDRLARIAFELDGTRPFRRTSPYGGSLHNYDTYWMLQDMDQALTLDAVFIGEFGMASAPNLQSVYRYIPEEERGVWDPAAKSALNYHTPRFNEFRWPEQYNDMDHLLYHAAAFGAIDSLETFVTNTQLAQAVAIRHTLERMRADSPRTTGVCYYKLTDVYPACSWSTVDYYGVPKIPYYVFKNAYAPLHAMLRVTSVTAVTDYPAVLLDDTLQAAGKPCRICVDLYDRQLQRLCREELSCTPAAAVNPVGTIRLEEPVRAALRLVSVRLYVEDTLCDSTFYLLNYREDVGFLYTLPATAVTLTADGDTLTLRNTGAYPAVGAFVEDLSCDTAFTVSDNFLLLEPGEERTLRANRTRGASVRGFNFPTVTA